MSHPPTPTRAQGSHCCAPPLPANARWLNGRGPKSIRGAIMGSHNALYGGRECPLAARWLLVGSEVRTPAPLRRANAKRAPLGQSGVRPLGRAFLCGGPPFPAPPAPPSPYLCPCVGVCVQMFGGGGVQTMLVVGGGVRGPSVVLRPATLRPHAACRPMCPAPRLRPRPACACGRGVRPRGHLAGRGPVRFKRPRARSPCPLAIALARCGLSLAHFGARFCHFRVTISPKCS